MEHVRCARCRNPIRGQQAAVRHPGSEMAFHLDCWGELHQDAQQEYHVQVASDGLDGLLGPYSRTRPTAWLPTNASDATGEDPADPGALGTLADVVGQTPESPETVT